MTTIQFNQRSNICKSFFSLAKKTRRNIGKCISRILSSNYIQKLLDHAKQSARDALKTASKIAIQKAAEAAGDLNGNKITDRITNVSNTSPQNNSETNEKEII